MTKTQADKFRMTIKQLLILINHLNSKLITNKSKLGSSIFFLKVIEGIPGKIHSSEPTIVNYMKIHSKI